MWPIKKKKEVAIKSDEIASNLDSYALIEETKDFAYFAIEPGIPVTIRHLQKMKDEGFKLVHAETKFALGNIQSYVVCEKIPEVKE